jgi:hypothetical protein
MARAAVPTKLGGLSKAEAMAARRNFYSTAMMVSMYSMAYALAMSDDDDYLHNPDRTGNYLLPVGKNDEDVQAIKIPVAFEVGWFTKELPEIMILYGLGAITGKEAYEQGKKQRLIMDEIMASPNIEQDWDSPQIMETILEQCSSFNFQT